MNDASDRQPSDWQKAGVIATVICRGIAMTAEIFLHRHIGERAVGATGTVGALALLAFMSFWPRHDIRPLLVLLVLYVAACGATQVAALRRRRRGRAFHSRYTGYPRIAKLLPWLDERRIKGGVEPLLLAVGGLLLMPVNVPFGAYMLVVSCAMSVATGAAESAERRRSTDLQDTFIEQQQLAERFRGTRNS